MNESRCLKCGKKVDSDVSLCVECLQIEISKNTTKSVSNVAVLSGNVSENIPPMNNGCNYVSTSGQSASYTNMNSSGVVYPIVEPVSNNDTLITKKKTILFEVIIVIVSIIVIIGCVKSYSDGVDTLDRLHSYDYYASIPPEINIYMDEWDGVVDYILEDFGIDFDYVTASANCYTGIQSKTFEHEKYGVLHIEFQYCASNETKILKIYNSDSDQVLRAPKFKEVPSYDSYGYRSEF